MVAIGLVALGTALWLRRPRPAPATAPSPADAMGPEAAFQAGLALASSGRHLASLPYFRSAVRQAPRSWSSRMNYMSSLANGAQEGRRHLGKEEPAVRSSVERVAMTLGALDENVAVEALARSPEDRALVASERARSFLTWGFPLDAAAEYARARALAGPGAGPSRDAVALARLLESGGPEGP